MLKELKLRLDSLLDLSELAVLTVDFQQLLVPIEVKVNLISVLFG